MAKSINYQNYLIESLKNPKEAAGYLNAALDSGDIAAFLLALQNVVQAHGGIAKLADKINKSRTSLYKTLAKTGNPYLKSTDNILRSMGMHLVVAATDRKLSKHRSAS